jgi:hypothetical protein
MCNPAPPWVVTLFAPPALRVSPQEYRQVLGEAALRRQLPPLYRWIPLATSRRPLAARLRACHRAWARHGRRPYDRSDGYNWVEQGEQIMEGEEDEA